MFKNIFQVDAECPEADWNIENYSPSLELLKEVKFSDRTNIDDHNYNEQKIKEFPRENLKSPYIHINNER